MPTCNICGSSTKDCYFFKYGLMTAQMEATIHEILEHNPEYSNIEELFPEYELHKYYICVECAKGYFGLLETKGIKPLSDWLKHLLTVVRWVKNLIFGRRKNYHKTYYV